MKKILLLFMVFAVTSACRKVEKPKKISTKSEVNTLLDDWHKAAANADFETYFNYFSDNSIFIGTDAKENWDKKAFQAFAKPYFDKGKAWSFTTLERNIYFNQDSTIAWYDELLDTQMKICRGSGVVIKEKDTWKIKHYVLSMNIPNEIVDKVVAEKEVIENEMITSLKNKQ